MSPIDTVAGCEFDCAGNIYINSPPYANSDSVFTAVDQFDNVGVANFTPQFTAVASSVPEPASLAIMAIGFVGIGFMVNRRKIKRAVLDA